MPKRRLGAPAIRQKRLGFGACERWAGRMNSDSIRETMNTLIATAGICMKSFPLAPGTKSGYKGVHFKPSKSKPYQATACGNRKNQHLGHFVTAEEAALCYARHIGKEACQAQLEKQMQGPPVPKTAAAEEAPPPVDETKPAPVKFVKSKKRSADETTRQRNKRKEGLGQAKFTLKEDRDCPSIWDGGKS